MLLHKTLVHVSKTIKPDLPPKASIGDVQRCLRAHGFVSAIHDAADVLAHIQGHSEARKIAGTVRAWFRFSEGDLTLDQARRSVELFEDNFGAVKTPQLRSDVIDALAGVKR
jgi:hypothetical protein